MPARVVWSTSVNYPDGGGSSVFDFPVAAFSSSFDTFVFVVAAGDGNVLTGMSTWFVDSSATIHSPYTAEQASSIGQPYGDYYGALISAPTAPGGGTLHVAMGPGNLGSGSGVLGAFLIGGDHCEVGFRGLSNTPNVGAGLPQQPNLCSAYIRILAGTRNIASIASGWSQFATRRVGGGPQIHTFLAVAADDAAAANTPDGVVLDFPPNAEGDNTIGITLFPYELLYVPTPQTTSPLAHAPELRADTPCAPVMEWASDVGGEGASATVPLEVTSAAGSDTAVLASISYFSPYTGPPFGTYVAHVNSPEPTIVGSGSITWSRESSASGLVVTGDFNEFTTGTPISNTPDPALYQSEHYGSTFTYTFTVNNGSYDVTLKFAEIFFANPGERVFNVSINGTAVLSNFDIVAAAGSSFRAIDQTFSVNVTGGQIQIVWTSVINNAKSSAVQVIPTPSVSPTLTTVVSGVTYGGVQLRRLNQAYSQTATVNVRFSPTVTATGVVVHEWWSIRGTTIATAGNLVATFTAGTSWSVGGFIIQRARTFGRAANTPGFGSTSPFPMTYSAPPLSSGALVANVIAGLGINSGPDVDSTDFTRTPWHRLIQHNYDNSRNYDSATLNFPLVTRSQIWVTSDNPAGPPDPRDSVNASGRPWIRSFLPIYGRSPAYTSAWRAWGASGYHFGAGLGTLNPDNWANYRAIMSTADLSGLDWDEFAAGGVNDVGVLGLSNGVVYFLGPDWYGTRGAGLQNSPQYTASTPTPFSGATFQPVRVPGLPSTIVKIAVGTTGTGWALAGNGDLYAFGPTYGGRLGALFASDPGSGTFPTGVWSPTPPFITLTNVEDMAPGIVLRRDGTVWMCGPTTAPTAQHAWTQITGFTRTPRTVRAEAESNSTLAYVIDTARQIWTCTLQNSAPAFLTCLEADDLVVTYQGLLRLLNGYVSYRGRSTDGQYATPIPANDGTWRQIQGIPLAVLISGVGQTLAALDSTGGLWMWALNNFGAAMFNGVMVYDEFGNVTPNTLPNRKVEIPRLLGGAYSLPATVHPSGFNFAWQRKSVLVDSYSAYARVGSSISFPDPRCPLQKIHIPQVIG